MPEDGHYPASPTHPSSRFPKGPQGDTQCLNGPTSGERGIAKKPFLQGAQHPFDDALIRERSPQTHLDRIHVPMLATLAWQDEQLDSRGTDSLAQLDDLNTVRRAHHHPEEQWYARFANGTTAWLAPRPSRRTWTASSRTF